MAKEPIPPLPKAVEKPAEALVQLGENVAKAIEKVIPPDKPTSRGRKQDRARVASGQKHEVRYEAKKTGKSAKRVKRVVKKVGNSRKGGARTKAVVRLSLIPQ